MFLRYCIPNAVEDTTNDRVLRLNLNAHPLAYVNDQDMGTAWRSKLMTTRELDKGLTITVDLVNGQYQVIQYQCFLYVPPPIFFLHLTRLIEVSSSFGIQFCRYHVSFIPPLRFRYSTSYFSLVAHCLSHF